MKQMKEASACDTHLENSRSRYSGGFLILFPCVRKPVRWRRFWNRRGQCAPAIPRSPLVCLIPIELVIGRKCPVAFGHSLDRSPTLILLGLDLDDAVLAGERVYLIAFLELKFGAEVFWRARHG